MSKKKPRRELSNEEKKFRRDIYAGMEAAQDEYERIVSPNTAVLEVMEELVASRQEAIDRENQHLATVQGINHLLQEAAESDKKRTCRERLTLILGFLTLLVALIAAFPILRNLWQFLLGGVP